MSSGEVNKGTIYETDQFITQAAYEATSTKLVPPGTVVMALAGQGKTRGTVARTRIELCTNQSLASIVVAEEMNSDFLYHYLQTQYQKLRDVSSGEGTRGGLNLQMIKAYLVPVPPLEVQCAIVDILDKFTALEAELEAELEARKKQYEHYRHQLVSESQLGEKLSLGELENHGVVKLGRGKVISKIALAETPGDYPVYSSSGMGKGEFGRYGLYMFEDERITWSVDGGGRFFYRHPHKFSVTNVSGWMTIDTSIIRVKYLYYVLTVQWEKQTFDYTRKAHPSVIRNVYEVHIPPLEEQDELVANLDKFDALVNDLSSGLPAEIAARRKQYEYYRDQLLTFKELAS